MGLAIRGGNPKPKEMPVGGGSVLQKLQEAMITRPVALQSDGAPALMGVLYHEIGNLLVGIQSATWLLMRDAREPKEARARYEAVQQACLRAEALLRRGLEQACSPISSTTMRRRLCLDLAQQVRDEVDLQLSTRPEQDRSPVRLCLEPAPVVGDPEELRLIIGNLLENALKFSPPGEKVVVRLRNRGSRVVLEVLDRGPGVDPGLKGRLFQPFQRGATTARGHGLGLWIVKRMVVNHGGRVGVRPRKGGGSRFRVSLPACPVTLAGW